MAEQPAIKTFYDISAASDALGTSRQFILDAIHNRDLPAIKIGGSAGYRIASSDLRLFIAHLRERQRPSREN
jgi:excisionase family DNA binding protein